MENFKPGWICIFNKWPGRKVTVKDVIYVVGEMIQLKRHNAPRDIIPSKICKEASKWVQRNTHLIPVDRSSLLNKVTTQQEEIIIESIMDPFGSEAMSTFKDVNEEIEIVSVKEMGNP
jgi:hypothetical protein